VWTLRIVGDSTELVPDRKILTSVQTVYEDPGLVFVTPGIHEWSLLLASRSRIREIPRALLSGKDCFSTWDGVSRVSASAQGKESIRRTMPPKPGRGACDIMMLT
jgi:hypothetical protein